MQKGSWKLTAVKVLLTLMGVVGLHLILKDFGYARIRNDILGLGWNFFPIVATYAIPYVFLALSWWVLLEKTHSLAFPYVFLVSLVANAWNNIGPVSKSLGEPTRVLLLSDRMPVRQALRGMMLFNLGQAMGTVFTFGTGAAVAPLVFSLSETAFWVTLTSALVALAINGLALFWILRPGKRSSRPTKGRTLRAVLHWVWWTTHQLRKYARHNTRRFCFSVGLAAMARLSEGVIFYAIFSALGSPLTLLESLAVDIGRGIADNAFFFVPYQLGTRELSLVFVTEAVLNKGQEAAVAASLVFRLGEIVWITAGFFLGVWMMRRRRIVQG